MKRKPLVDFFDGTRLVVNEAAEEADLVIYDQFGVVSKDSPNFWGTELAQEAADKFNALFAQDKGFIRLTHPTKDEDERGNWSPLDEVAKPIRAEVVNADPDGRKGTFLKVSAKIHNTTSGNDLKALLKSKKALPVSRSIFAERKPGSIDGHSKQIVIGGDSFQPVAIDLVGEGGFANSKARLREVIQEAAAYQEETTETEDINMEFKDLYEKAVKDLADRDSRLANLTTEQGKANNMLATVSKERDEAKAAHDATVKELEAAKTIIKENETAKAEADAAKARETAHAAFVAHMEAEIAKCANAALCRGILADDAKDDGHDSADLAAYYMKRNGDDPAKATADFNRDCKKAVRQAGDKGIPASNSKAIADAILAGGVLPLEDNPNEPPIDVYEDDSLKQAAQETRERLNANK